MTRLLPLQRFRVEDRSMEPELLPGDFVIVNRWSYRIGSPERGDVVVLRDPEAPDRYLVKRIADIMNGGAYFVAGDNAGSSRDSRTFGPVGKELIVGRVWRHVRP